MNFSAHARARARRYAMQALYQWDLSGTDLPLIREQFLVNEDFTRTDQPYFMALLSDLPARADVVDASIAEFTDRPLAPLDPVERAILRIGVYELQQRIDIPYRVVINEAVQLAKKFGAEQGHAFVNGVLDRAASKLRPMEYNKTGGQAG